MRKYFAMWSPYRMGKVHVEFIGKKEIYEPDSILEGVDGTMKMYHFAGANTPKYDAQTTTEGLEDDERRAPGAEKGGVLDERREESIGGPGGGQGDARYGNAARRWSKQAGIGRADGWLLREKRNGSTGLKTRRALCFCSACQRFQYQDCHVNKAYSGIVTTDEKVEETIDVDTVVAPGGVAAPPVAPVSGGMPKAIKFAPWKKECKAQRVTGTQWQESDTEAASKLWEELGREEEPTRRWTCFWV